MKHKSLILIAMLVVVTALFGGCSIVAIFNGVIGSGTIASEERSVVGFSGVSNTGSAAVTIVPGSAYRVQVTTDDNLLSYITTDVQGGTLTIGLKPGASIIHANRLDVLVCLPTLERVATSGSGSVTVSAMAVVPSFSVATTGSGSVTAVVDATDVDVQTTGSGGVALSGTALRETVSITGSGPVDDRSLSASYATVTIAGSGSAWINASSSLDVAIYGSGNLYYRGGAPVSAAYYGSGSAYPF